MQPAYAADIWNEGLNKRLGTDMPHSTQHHRQMYQCRILHKQLQVNTHHPEATFHLLLTPHTHLSRVLIHHLHTHLSLLIFLNYSHQIQLTPSTIWIPISSRYNIKGHTTTLILDIRSTRRLHLVLFHWMMFILIKDCLIQRLP